MWKAVDDDLVAKDVLDAAYDVAPKSGKGVRHVEEHRVVRPRLPPEPLDELLPLDAKHFGHLAGHRDRLVNRAARVFGVLDPLLEAADLVLLPATARARGVPGQLLAGHACALLRPSASVADAIESG